MNRDSRFRSPIHIPSWRLVSGLGAAAILLHPLQVVAEHATDVAPPNGTHERPSHQADTAPRESSSAATSAANAITPPRLVHFESAPYPPEAEHAGLEAAVAIALTIDAEGHVIKAEVHEPAGHGFDEAAVVAAQKFVFEPATRNGTPVPAKILYRYGFKLEAKSTTQSTAAEPPPLGELGGRIVAGTPAAPLVGVVIRLKRKDGDPSTFVTSTDGTWSAPYLPPGDYAVEVEAVGYRRVHQLEHVEGNEATKVTYHLESSDEMPLEVTVRGAAVHREVSHYQLARTELMRVPGTFGDTIHAVEAMPSVARAPAFSGALIVRGSNPQDTQVFLEGTPIPAVFHYGSIASVIPSEMVERLEFYPGNFSVRYGRGKGGIVEIGLRQTNPDGKYHGSAQIDFINARANVEGPLPVMRGWSFMAGGRMAYLDRWLVPVLRNSGSGIDAVPRYYDYQLRIERRLPNNGVYQIGIFGASDEFVPIEKDPRDWRAPTQAFGHLQSHLRLPLTSRLDFKASWSLGRNVSRDPGSNERNYKTTYTLGTFRTELAARTGDLGIARVGTDVLYAPFTLDATTDSPVEGGEQSTRGTDSPRLEQYKLREVHFRPAAFAEYELAPNRRINVTAGARVDYTRDTDEVNWSPRLSARYVLTDGPYGTLVKGGVGVFYQPPDPSQTLSRLGNPSLDSSHALHSMLGFEQSLSHQVTLSVEGFQKELRDLVAWTRDGSGKYVSENSGTGRVWGADFLLRYRADERFFGWISYTLSRAHRTQAPGEPEKLFAYDQPHIINVLASYRLGRGWEVGGRFRFMSGFLYDACQGGIYNNATGRYGCYGSTVQRRLAPFHQLDLRIEKAWRFKSGQVSLYMDVINAYNRESPDLVRFNFDRSAVKPQSFSLPVLPSIGVRGEL